MRTEALNYLRLSSRVDAAASRVQTACGMKAVTESMMKTVRAMGIAMNGMDMLRIVDVMARFEALMEDLDVKADHVDGAISQTTAALTPTDEVNVLIQQVADEHNLVLVGRFGTTPTVNPVPKATPRSSALMEEQDELTLRLARLARQ
jgi:charged multivesicular body protein 1